VPHPPGVGLFRLSSVVSDAAIVAPGGAMAASRPFKTGSVAFEGHRLHVRDYAGNGPPIVLMHGFPDDLHLYDRVFPLLHGRRVIAFDFLGWGHSDKPRGHVYTFAEQERELDSVVKRLALGQIVAVVHDMSGPAGINWALDHPTGVAGLVLLNTLYSVMPTVNAPQAIRIFSQPEFADLAQAIGGHPKIMHWLYNWQVGRFMSDPRVRAQTLKKFWPIFRSSIPAFASANRDLIPATLAATAREPELTQFNRPVRIIFGERDPYLNAGIARRFHELMPTSDLFLLPARHYVQVDNPGRVAQLITTMASGAG
jgi:haloalkane dehalogenase